MQADVTDLNKTFTFSNLKNQISVEKHDVFSLQREIRGRISVGKVNELQLDKLRVKTLNRKQKHNPGTASWLIAHSNHGTHRG